ncbi:MAG: V-type ATP synthase subunit A [Nocardioidaceae bacterium]
MTGTITRVNGPLVEAEDLPRVAMYDVVELGHDRLPGEVVAVRGSVATVQAYEYTGGLAPGDPARGRGEPLSVQLGPGLLGGVFDGLLRPLSDAPTWLVPAALDRSAGATRWPFRPLVAPGDVVIAGEALGVVESGPLPYLVQVPPGVGGQVEDVAAEGEYDADRPVATVAGVAVQLHTRWAVRRPRPYRARLDTVEGLHTGQRVIDLLYPLARGGTAGVPGGFGTGKTVLLQQVAKWCDADVIVYVGCGERGNEMADVVRELAELEDPRTGDTLARRTVVIANTSNMPMMAREASIYTGVTVGEYFRDMGRDCVVIADSTTRWAEALREMSSRTNALPAEEGYPANLASALAAFYERAGRVTTLAGQIGSVSVVGAVSPPGGDMTEPVTAHTQRFVRCQWSLDRDLAYARHYPAVSWSASFGRDIERFAAWHTRAGNPSWVERRHRVSELLAEAERLSALAELVGVAALPGHERMVMLAGRLLREAVLQQSALSVHDAFCSAAKAGALVDAVLGVVDRCRELVGSGVPAAAVEEVDFATLIHARDAVGPDDVAGVEAQRDLMLARLEELRP